MKPHFGPGRNSLWPVNFGPHRSCHTYFTRPWH